MNNEKPVEKVIFNNDVFELEEEKNDDENRVRIIYVNHPPIRMIGIYTMIIGLVLCSGACGYNLGADNFGGGSRFVFYIALLSFFIVILGIIMIIHSSDVYYKKDG